MKAAFRPGCALQVSHGMAVFVRHHVPVKRLERTQVHFRHLLPSIAANPVKSLSWRGTVGDDFLENGRFGNACDGFDMLRQFIQGLENRSGVGFGFADVEFVVFMCIIRFDVYFFFLIKQRYQGGEIIGIFKNANIKSIVLAKKLYLVFQVINGRYEFKLPIFIQPAISNQLSQSWRHLSSVCNANHGAMQWQKFGEPMIYGKLNPDCYSIPFGYFLARIF